MDEPFVPNRPIWDIINNICQHHRISFKKMFGVAKRIGQNVARGKIVLKVQQLVLISGVFRWNSLTQTHSIIELSYCQKLL
jgi:hypothetical protein